AARLSPAWRVLVPDLPGQGDSAPRPGGPGPTISALSVWASAVAPDLKAVVGAGAGGGSLATSVAAECESMGVGCGLEEEIPAPDAPVPPFAWPGYWEMFSDLRSRPPFRAWRPDVLWWLVEEGTRALESGGIRAKASQESVRGLSESPRASGPFRSLEKSP